MLTFWRTLRRNPIYQRERGRWGEPNPFFATLNRYSPFIILGTLLMGVCSACRENSSFLGGDNEAFIVFGLLLCLPNFALQALTWAGAVMVPVLTAPAVSEERKRGTWDMLRLTPQPMIEILIAKMFGSLARLKIWWPLLIFSLIQAGATAVGLLAAPLSSGGQFSIVFWALLMAVGLVLRPWSEIAFAALVGINVSTWVNSGRIALVFTYVAVIFTKMLNNSLLWVGILFFSIEGAGSLEAAVPAVAALGPTLIYVAAVALLSLLLVWRADNAHAWSAENIRS